MSIGNSAHMGEGNLQFTEEELSDLFDLLSGTGQSGWGFFSSGIHTYPKGNDNNKRLFAACRELEKRGLVYRVDDEPDHVVFIAYDKKFA